MTQQISGQEFGVLFVSCSLTGLNLTMQLHQLRKSLNRVIEKERTLKHQIELEQLSLKNAKQNLADLEQAQEIIQTVAQKVQQEAHKHIASVVTRCLQSVFPEPYEFDIEFVQKRGKTEAVLTFKRNDLRVKPMRGAGGGVVDVAAFALRLACLSLRQPPGRRFVALDEPFKHVSQDNQERIRDMLEALSRDMGFQFLFATHEDELVCGKVIQLRRKEPTGEDV